MWLANLDKNGTIAFHFFFTKKKHENAVLENVDD